MWDARTGGRTNAQALWLEYKDMKQKDKQLVCEA